MVENQLTDFRKKQLEKFTKIKKPHVSPKSNENLHKWDRNTTLIVGDSELFGIERRISKRDRKVKVKNFPGATIDDMYDYIKPLLKNVLIIYHTVGLITRLMSHPKWCLINCLT